MSIIYAGIFEVSIEGVQGRALCTNSDEIQELTDAIAEEGFVGHPVDVTHHKDQYRAVPNSERLDDNLAWLGRSIEMLKKQRAEAS